MKGNFHVQFLGEGVAATSPPYPTPGWATTQVYPARAAGDPERLGPRAAANRDQTGDTTEACTRKTHSRHDTRTSLAEFRSRRCIGPTHARVAHDKVAVLSIVRWNRQRRRRDRMIYVTREQQTHVEDQIFLAPATGVSNDEMQRSKRGTSGSDRLGASAGIGVRPI